MIVIEGDQRTEAWTEHRLGHPTVSQFDRIVTTKGEPSKQRQAYLYQLASERITGRKEEGYKSAAMEAGTEMEPEARALYELLNDVEVRQVAICYKDESRTVSGSPDGLVEPDGGVEIKCVLPKTQAYYIHKGKLPTDYFQQVHGYLYITDRKWWDFFSMAPDMPPFQIRVERDEKFLEALHKELERFNQELDEITDKIRRAA